MSRLIQPEINNLHQLFQDIDENINDFKVMTGWPNLSAKNFKESLNLFLQSFPVGGKVARIDESSTTIESFVAMPETLREWVGSIEDDRVWNSNWVSSASVVLYEAYKLIESIDAISEKYLSSDIVQAAQEIKDKIFEGLEESDLPSKYAKFKNNPELGAITHAHESINDIINFLNEFVSKEGHPEGEVNFFNALLNKSAKQQSIVSRNKGAVTRNNFSKAINALENEDVAPEDYKELLRNMAETFEKNSGAGRRRMDRLSKSMKSLVNSLSYPVVLNKLETIPGIKSRIRKFKEYAEAFSSIAKEIYDLGNSVIELKNVNAKNRKEGQKTWNMARQLIKRSFNNISKIGGVDREIDVRGIVKDLNKVSQALDEVRKESSSQYRTAKAANKNLSPIPTKSAEEEKPNLETSEKTTEERDQPKDYYTERQVIHRLGLSNVVELQNLIKGKGGMLHPLVAHVIKKGTDKFYKKQDIEDYVNGGWAGAPKEVPPGSRIKPIGSDFEPKLPGSQPLSDMPPDSEEKPGSKDDLSSQMKPPEGTKPAKDKERTDVPLIPKDNAAKPLYMSKPPSSPAMPDYGRRPSINDPEYKNYSATAREAFEKPIENENLKNRLQKSLYPQAAEPKVAVRAEYPEWATGMARISFNPWFFYMALRGQGDDIVSGQQLESRINDIFQTSMSNSKNNPWSLLQAYDTLKNRVASHELENGPTSEKIAEMIAKNIPRDIEELARNEKVLKRTYFSGIKLSDEFQKIRNWLNKIPKKYSYARSVASDIIVSRLPTSLRDDFLEEV